MKKKSIKLQKTDCSTIVYVDGEKIGLVTRNHGVGWAFNRFHSKIQYMGETAEDAVLCYLNAVGM